MRLHRARYRLLCLGLCLLFGTSAGASAKETPLPKETEAITADASSEWTAEEAVIGGISFALATPDAVIETLGTPHTDEETQEITYKLRTLLYPGMMFEFVLVGQAWRLEAVRVSNGGLLGPKDLRIGDTRESVLQRFGEGNDDDESLMYTTRGENSKIVSHDGISQETLADADSQGDAFALTCSFFDDVLTEYLLYRI